MFWKGILKPMSLNHGSRWGSARMSDGRLMPWKLALFALVLVELRVLCATAVGDI